MTQPKRPSMRPGSRETKLPHVRTTGLDEGCELKGTAMTMELGLVGERHARLKTTIGDSLKVGTMETGEVKQKEIKGANKILWEMFINP